MIAQAKRGVLVFDFGTSKVRAVLINVDNGDALVRESFGYAGNSRRGELSAPTIWTAAELAAEGVIGAVGCETTEIVAVIFSWFGANLVPLDRTGEALYPVIVGYDSRAKVQSEILLSLVPKTIADKVPRGGLCGQSVPAKVLWIKQHEPKVFAQAETFASVQQFVLGKLGFPSIWDRTIAAASQYYDVERERWITPLLQATDSRAMGEQLCDCDEILGEINRIGSVRLPHSVPLLVGGHDCVLAQMGQGLMPYDSNLLSDMAGTYDLMSFFHKGYLNTSQADCITAPCEDNFSIIAGNPSGAILSNAVGQLYSARATANIGRLFEGAVFDGTRQLRLDLGQISEGHWPANGSRQEFFSAAVEMLTLEQRKCFQVLSKLHGKPFSSMRVGGGGSQSNQWLQLKANMFGIPVERCRNLESSSLGAAIVASVKLGIHENYEQAIQSMCTLERVFDPDSICAKRYSSW